MEDLSGGFSTYITVAYKVHELTSKRLKKVPEPTIGGLKSHLTQMSLTLKISMSPSI